MGNLRRGAMMATLRCDHPDTEEFIDAKISGDSFAHFTLSVALTDDLMRAVEECGPRPLLFPLGQHPIPVGGEVCERIWSGAMTSQLCLVHRRVPARALWEKLPCTPVPSRAFCSWIASTAPIACGAASASPPGLADMFAIRDMAYRTSVEIAQENGAFPGFDQVRYGASPFVLDLAHDLQDAIAQHGIRKSHLLAVAPTGSISLLANTVSSGVEPIFALQTLREIQGADGQPLTFEVSNAALRQYRQVDGTHGPIPAPCACSVRWINSIL
jgi:ribonucleotide reductase alpha subunit